MTEEIWRQPPGKNMTAVAIWTGRKKSGKLTSETCLGLAA